MSIIAWIIGAFVGGFIASLLGFAYAQGFNLASIVVATIGAIVFLWILGLIKGRRAR